MVMVGEFVEIGGVMSAKRDGHESALSEIGRRLCESSDMIASVSVEYPGYLAVHTDDGAVWHIGVVNGAWGAEYYADATDLSSPSSCVTTTMPADTPLGAVADALMTQMAADVH